MEGWKNTAILGNWIKVSQIENSTIMVSGNLASELKNSELKNCIQLMEETGIH